MCILNLSDTGKAQRWIHQSCIFRQYPDADGFDLPCRASKFINWTTIDTNYILYLLTQTQEEGWYMAEHRGGSGNFAEDREKASEAGRKGGQHSGGNFKNDPQRASEAGKKGGKTVTAEAVNLIIPELV